MCHALQKSKKAKELLVEEILKLVEGKELNKKENKDYKEVKIPFDWHQQIETKINNENIEPRLVISNINREMKHLREEFKQCHVRHKKQCNVQVII